MPPIKITDTLADIVTQNPCLSRLFEEEGIDYCCGGKKNLETACREKGLSPSELISKLEQRMKSASQEQTVDASTMSLTELADHIEQTHHAYLRNEFPRLDKLTEKVATVHGSQNRSLYQVRETYQAMRDELLSHLAKEEQILFPLIRQIEANESPTSFHCGSIANPIRQMELEHTEAGSALEKLHSLTNGYRAPESACNTYRAMLDALAELERDLHQHIHKENNILFPRAIKMESEKNK